MNDMHTTIVGLVSLGCPKNLIDSEAMLGRLAEAGCVICGDADEADVLVVNTCGFIGPAREESLSVLREALELKRSGSLRRVVAAGCLSQRDGEALRASLPGLDAVVGVNNRDDLVRAVLGEGPFSATAGYADVRRAAGGDVLADDTARLRLTPPHTAYLRISEGCGQGCTFCTIPAIRGPFRSKPVQAVLNEARELIDDGAIELNIIGQDTTSYGRDIGYEAGLAGLLRELDGIDGVRWLRLMYAYPSLVGVDLIEALAECNRVVKYLDIPLQHIADGVLERMRRRITRAETEALLRRLRDRVDDLVLRTTFIVGFPGETDEDFEALLEFVQAFRFDAAGVFVYSSEAGTPASKFDGVVPDDVAAERMHRLMMAQQEIAFAANAARVGKELNVLVDGPGDDDVLVGRHAGQAPEVDSLCLFTGMAREGQIVRTRVVDYQDYDLIVEPIGNRSGKPGKGKGRTNRGRSRA